MTYTKIIVVTNTQKSRLLELNNNTLKVLDGFRLTRLAIKTYLSILISLLAFLVIILMALASSSFEKIFVDLFSKNGQNDINTNLKINTCYQGLTTGCYTNGLFNPIPVIEYRDIYTETGSGVLV